MFRETGSGPSFREWKHGRGNARLDWKSNAITRLRMVGDAHREIAGILIEHWKTMVETRSKLTILFDTWDLEGYDSEVRVAWTQWIRDHRSSVSAIHVALRSKLVAMGVSVANLALGGMVQVYNERASFDRVVTSFGFPLETRSGSRNQGVL